MTRGSAHLRALQQRRAGEAVSVFMWVTGNLEDEKPEGY